MNKEGKEKQKLSSLVFVKMKECNKNKKQNLYHE